MLPPPSPTSSASPKKSQTTTSTAPPASSPRPAPKPGKKKSRSSLFLQAIQSSTLSETYLNYADFLAAQGRTAEARQWAQKVLDKERTMPTYLRRRERPWFQSAAEMLKRLPA